MTPHGVALVDKPAGMSSFSVVSRLRRVMRPLGVSKVGHTGTLDPLATGLLPICISEATKFAQRLLDSDKGYLATVQFGAATTTGDAEGEVTHRSDRSLTASDVAAALATFQGPIRQKPPAFSALKIAGKPAYEYARAGQSVEIAEREVTIHAITLLAFDEATQRADIEVLCSKGTYIRSLAVNLAVALGSAGHLAALRRTRTGGFSLSEARPLDAWMEASDEQRLAWLLPTDSLVIDLPRIDLDTANATNLCNGKLVALSRVANADVSGATADSTLCRVYTGDAPARFIGLGRLGDSGILRVERLLSTK